MKKITSSNYYKIYGGKKLSGTIITNGAKNSTMGLLCASILNDGKTTLYNVPEIEEVFRMIEIMQSIGMNTKWLKKNVLEIVPPKNMIFQISILLQLKKREV